MICHEDDFRLFCHIRVKLSWMTLLTYLLEKTFLVPVEVVQDEKYVHVSVSYII